MDSHIQFYPVSCLEKVFPDEQPNECYRDFKLTGLKREAICFQAALRYEKLPGELCVGPQRKKYSVKIESAVNADISCRQVKLVPSNLPVPTEIDENYLRTSVGMYPDRLSGLSDGMCYLPIGQWTSLWIEIHTSEETAAGTYPVTVILSDKKGNEAARFTVELTVINAVLPEMQLIYTQWFHADCLANYYGVPAYSEEHWRIIENFVNTAVGMGINMILTPVITPPLDTSPKARRTDVQLLDISVENGKYSFGFGKLKRWVDMCLKCGIEYFEICHLFTQWGSESCPNIYAEVDGERQLIFSMNTSAGDGKYKAFLEAMLPELIKRLKEWGIAGKCYFHISDEPSIAHLDSYCFAKKIVEPFLKEFPIIDAVSDFEFYKDGVMQHPICATDRIEPFLNAGISELWAYYCGGQSVGVSNRFFSMPSRRNRVIGIQLYRNSIKGFLQWGYNFYNSAFSYKQIDPYAVTDADCAFASGDAFSVYPGENGVPEESITGRVFFLGLQDLRALQLLERLKGREYAVDILEKAAKDKVTFKYQPENDRRMLEIREKINDEIAEAI